jgi:hypothetical protein
LPYLKVEILVSVEGAPGLDDDGADGVVLGVRGGLVGLLIIVDGVAVAAKESILVASLLVSIGEFSIHYL